MSTTDLFGAFVASLASHLDDHEAGGDDVAARLHLSRSHLDRVVAGAAGESAGRFRRRVLLERAAFRLMTTRVGVLDIAVEAGYSSHEAFTRAFARAYGSAPSVWRSSPTRIQLETPSGVHFHPPGGLRLPAHEKVTSMDLLIRMVEHHVWLIAEMVERAEQLPGEVLDAPIAISVEGVDDEPTLRSLLSRLIGQMHMWNDVIAHRDYDWALEERESLDAMARRLRDQGDTFLGHVRDVVRQGRLDETFVDAHCDPAEVYTYGGLIAHVLTFAAYRRTLVVGALASAGIRDLRYGDPRTWVAETV